MMNNNVSKKIEKLIKAQSKDKTVEKLVKSQAKKLVRDSIIRPILNDKSKKIFSDAALNYLIDIIGKSFATSMSKQVLQKQAQIKVREKPKTKEELYIELIEREASFRDN